MIPDLFLQRHSNQSERIAWLFEALAVDCRIVFINPLFRRPLEQATGQPELPALQTEDRLYVGMESILRWLSGRPNYVSLCPTEVIAHVTLEALLYYAESRLSPLTQKIHYRFLLEDAKEFDDCFLSPIPSVFRGMVRFLAKTYLRRQFGSMPFDQEKEARELGYAMKFLSGFLEGRDYCFENRLTLADITLCSYLYPLLYQKRFTQDSNEELLTWVINVYKKHRHASIYQPLWHPVAG